jgi:WD40 repeat protein
MINTYKQLTSVTLSDQQNFIACGFEDSSIKVFDLRVSSAHPSLIEEQRLQELQGHFDPKQGHRAGAGPIQQNGKVLNARSDLNPKTPSEKSFILVGHSNPVYSLSIQLDEQFLISGGADNTIRLWDLTSKKLLVIY